MNTKMAPMDQKRHVSLEELRRRHGSLHEAPVRRRDEKKGEGGKRRDGGAGGFGFRGDSGSNGNGGSYGKGGGNGNDNNGPNNKGNNDNDDRKANPLDNPLDNPLFPPSNPTKVSTSTAIVVSTTATPAPAALSASVSPAISVTSSTPTGTFVSPYFPITTSMSADPSFTVPYSAETSSQPRKGLNMYGYPDYSTSTSASKSQKGPTTMTEYSAATPETVLGSTPTPIATLESGGGGVHYKKSEGLSPLAKQFLIAAGAIGAFIIIAAAIYFLTRMVKLNVRSNLRKRTFSRRGARGWYGWRKQETDYPPDPPPRYPVEEFPSDEKAIPAQRSLDAFFSPMARLPLATPAGAAALASADPQRRETVRAALLDNPAPTEVLSVAQTGTLPAIQNFYNVLPQNSNLSRQPGTQVSLPSRTVSNYNNTGTQNTFLTRQTSGAYDPNQREVNHLSYISSLSSGFGDGLIILESTVNGASQQGYRQSRSQGAARFSWDTSVRDRDTVYTQASIESAPRFRTINSWVAQQSGRVERQLQSDAEVPAMPSIPLPLQAGVEHQRQPSEDQALRAHPGDEITFSGGSRVPSEILDKTIGLKE